VPTADIIELAKTYGRYGYRRVKALLRHGGYGYCESFNSKLRDELLDGAIVYSLAEAQILILILILIEAWRRH